jgi:chromosome segregation ATPase
MSYDGDLDDERAETVVLVDDLKNQLQRAEMASEEYSKHLGVLQVRLDDALKEQGKLEDQAHEKDLKIETLQNHVRESTRQRKDLEQAYEADRVALLHEKEQQASREEELHFTIQRLKETIAQRDLRPNAEHEGKLSRSCKSTSQYCYGRLLTFVQRASGIDHHRILTTVNSPLPQLSTEVLHATIQRSSCRKTR